MPSRRTRGAVDREALVSLMLADMPPKSLRLAVLELAGIPTSNALAMLGIRREHHSRTIAGRTSGAPKRVQKRRT